jgi:hypothetical protein
MQQQHEAIATMGHANWSCNEAPTNFEFKLGNIIPPPPPPELLQAKVMLLMLEQIMVP